MNNVFVFDTYARDEQGKVLHFDVLVDTNNQGLALNFAKQWLESVSLPNKNINQVGCQFCHVQSCTAEVDKNIKEHGYHIIKLEGF